MLVRSVLVTPLLLALASPTLAQTVTTPPATSEPATAGKAPDACRLLPQADLRRSFPAARSPPRAQR